MAQPKFKPGDRVRLKSGGPTMTVVSLGKYGDGVAESYKCRWFDNRKQLAEDTFTEEELELSSSNSAFIFETL